MKLYAQGDWAREGEGVEMPDPEPAVYLGCGEPQYVTPDPDDQDCVIVWERHRVPCPVGFPTDVADKERGR